jgi:hypothetical protein
VDLRARDARVQDVAHNGNAELAEVALEVADREHVEQALRGMGVAPVPRVHDVDVLCDVPRDQIRRSAFGMPHHEHVGLHRREVRDGVEHRFAFRRRRDVDREVDHVRRKALRRDFESRPRSRRRLEEQVEDRLAAQQRHLLDLALAHADKRLGRVEDLAQDIRRQPVGGEQVVKLAVLVELRVLVEEHWPVP